MISEFSQIKVPSQPCIRNKVYWQHDNIEVFYLAPVWYFWIFENFTFCQQLSHDELRKDVEPIYFASIRNKIKFAQISEMKLENLYP